MKDQRIMRVGENGYDGRFCYHGAYSCLNLPSTTLTAIFDQAAYEWNAIDKIMHKAKRNLRPLLRFLTLQGTPANTELLNVLATMMEAFSKGAPLLLSHLPTSIIPAKLRRYILNSEGTIIRDRYKFLVYRLLRDRIEAGDIYCNDSAGFRSFEDDLVDDKTFQQRHDIFAQHGLEVASWSIQNKLDELGSLLNECFDAVNLRIH